MSFPETTAANTAGSVAAFGTLALRMGQMAAASAFVVGERIPLMAAACWNPWTADHEELGRMVPEKMCAFATATASMATGWWETQSATAAYAARALHASLAFGSRPTPDAAFALIAQAVSHNTLAMSRVVQTAENALSPLHEGVTANAERLLAARSRR